MKKLYIIISLYITLIFVIFFLLYQVTKRPQGFVIKKWIWEEGGINYYTNNSWTNIGCTNVYYIDIIYMTRLGKLQKGIIYVSKDVYDMADPFDIVQYSGIPWDGIHGHYRNGWYFNSLFDNKLPN